MTTYTEMTEKAAEQLLAAVQPMNDLTKSIADKTIDTLGKLPSLPTPEGVPTPLEVVTAHFAFAEQLLTAQKDFAFRLAGAVTAGPTAAATSAPKSAATSRPKAATSRSKAATSRSKAATSRSKA